MTMRQRLANYWLWTLCLFASLSPSAVNGFYAQPEPVSFSIQPPREVVGCAGCGAVQLQCGLSRQQTTADLPDPVLEWILYGEPVSFGEVAPDFNETHTWSTLILNNPDPSQSGVYQCMATDGNHQHFCGTTKLPCVTTVTLSDQTRVQIIGEIVEIKDVELSHCSLRLLGCGSFHVGMASQLHLHWTIDGQDTNEVRVLSNGALVLSTDDLRDDTIVQGLYQCWMTAANGGNITVASYNVTTRQYLVEEDEFQTVKVVSAQSVYAESETVGLVCMHNSSCPVISWRFNGSVLSNSAVLVLERVSVQQAGEYCCTVNVTSGRMHEACLQVDIHQDIGIMAVEVNTIFPEANSSVEIHTPSFNVHPVIWYYNGFVLDGETGQSLSWDRGMYGIYQSFAAIRDSPLVMTSLTRVMPSDRVNPPSLPLMREVPRPRFSNYLLFVIIISWDRPLYTAALDQLLYRLHDDISGNEWIVNTTSREIVIELDDFVDYSVEVIDSRGVAVSDSNRTLLSKVPNRQCEDVLTPPITFLYCLNGWVNITLSGGPTNVVSSLGVYYIQGSCTLGNQTVSISHKLEGISFHGLQLFPAGTHCSIQAAATTEDFDLCTGEACFCQDPGNLQYSAPVSCLATGEVNFKLLGVSNVSESVGSLEVCVTSHGPFLLYYPTVTINAYSQSAKESIDFEAPAVTELTLTGAETCFSVTVLNDTVLENTEQFLLTLSSTSPVINTENAHVTITIKDDDYVNVSLNGSAALEKDKSIQLCLEVDHISERNFTISMKTISGTAIEGRDFTGVDKELTLSGRHCENIEIINDSILEDQEFFVLQINSSDPGVLIFKNEKKLLIHDNDYVNISLTGPSAVSEGDPYLELDVCMEGVTERSIDISVDILPGTAQREKDYRHHPDQNLTFTPDTSCNNMIISLVDDDEWENRTLSFTVDILSNDSGVRILKGTVQIDINDDDTPPPPPMPTDQLAEGMLVVSGVVAGFTTFIIIIALMACAVWLYFYHKNKHLTYAEQKAKKTNFKNEDSLRDENDPSIEFHVMSYNVSKNSVDDQLSVYDCYYDDQSKTNNFIDTQSISGSTLQSGIAIPAPFQSQLERDTMDFCKEGIDSSSDVGTDYVDWKDSSVRQSSNAYSLETCSEGTMSAQSSNSKILQADGLAEDTSHSSPSESIIFSLDDNTDHTSASQTHSHC